MFLSRKAHMSLRTPVNMGKVLKLVLFYYLEGEAMQAHYHQVTPEDPLHGVPHLDAALPPQVIDLLQETADPSQSGADPPNRAAAPSLQSDQAESPLEETNEPAEETNPVAKGGREAREPSKAELAARREARKVTLRALSTEAQGQSLIGWLNTLKGATKQAWPAVEANLRRAYDPADKTEQPVRLRLTPSDSIDEDPYSGILARVRAAPAPPSLPARPHPPFPPAAVSLLTKRPRDNLHSGAQTSRSGPRRRWRACSSSK